MIYTTFPTLIGQLVATAENGALTALYESETVPERAESIKARSETVFCRLGEQLDDYWKGEAVSFDIPVAPSGTPFQIRVWRALRDIPYGHTISYGELAQRIGKPTAVRAVGRANGANPIAIVIPCHRVIGGNGSLVGYAGGLERKKALLSLEGALSGAEPKSASGGRIG
ncbi:MAG: methylated-DNA-[protein]-cysteine S-methyltransferase [Actinomycetota bacterium]|jgi:methylated-DNA-[protein]-cysteine S-methyltransferase|nr:methylated-DNA-[protein]-cysteine S-methyltransferase [Actinomycetota bacterium]